MIAKEELMIGDWVEPHQCRVPTLYCKVEGIYPDGTVSLSEAERLFTLDEIEPVFLTNEILKKNGILYQYGNPWYQGGYDDTYEFRYMSDATKLEVKIPVKYVHQLQRALNLCGIQKEIIL